MRRRRRRPRAGHVRHGSPAPRRPAERAKKPGSSSWPTAIDRARRASRGTRAWPARRGSPSARRRRRPSASGRAPRDRTRCRGSGRRRPARPARRGGRRRCRPSRRRGSRPRAPRSSSPRRSSPPSHPRRARPRGSAGRPCGPTRPGAVASASSAAASRPTSSRPSWIATVAGTAPAARTAASDARRDLEVLRIRQAVADQRRFERDDRAAGGEGAAATSGAIAQTVGDAARIGHADKRSVATTLSLMPSRRPHDARGHPPPGRGRGARPVGRRPPRGRRPALDPGRPVREPPATRSRSTGDGSRRPRQLTVGPRPRRPAATLARTARHAGVRPHRPDRRRRPDRARPRRRPRSGAAASARRAATARSARSPGRPTAGGWRSPPRSTRRGSWSGRCPPVDVAARRTAGAAERGRPSAPTRLAARPRGSPGPTGAGTRSGHLDRWSHLFVVDARAGRDARQVTAGDWGVSRHRLGARRPNGRVHRRPRRRAPTSRPRTTIWAVDVDARRRRRRRAEPREVLAPAGSPNHPAYSPDGRWLAAIGVLDARSARRHQPGDPRRTGRRLRPPPRALAPDLDRPIGNWTDTDLNGWMVSGRPGPYWLDAGTIVATVSDRGRSHPVRFRLDPRTGAADRPADRDAARRATARGRTRRATRSAVAPTGTIAVLGHARDPGAWS